MWISIPPSAAIVVDGRFDSHFLESARSNEDRMWNKLGGDAPIVCQSETDNAWFQSFQLSDFYMFWTSKSLANSRKLRWHSRLAAHVRTPTDKPSRDDPEHRRSFRSSIAQMLVMPVPLRYGIGNCRAATDTVMHHSDSITLHGLMIAALTVPITVPSMAASIRAAMVKGRCLGHLRNRCRWRNRAPEVSAPLPLKTLNNMYGTR